MARKFWFNVLATLLGLAGEGIGFWLGELLLVDVLGNIPIIPKLLSWPVDYSWYAAAATIGLSIFCGVYLSGKLCELANTKYNYGLIAWGAFYTIYYIGSMVWNFSHEGFSLAMLILFLIAIIGHAVCVVTCIKGDID